MTEQQLRALEFIREKVASLGVSPTMAEIAGKLGISESRANDLVHALVRMGKVERQRGRSRSLSIVGAPDVRLIDSETMLAELARRGVTMGALEAPRRLAYGRRAVACAADCCQVEVRRGHLFCLDHWRMLTPELRSEILDTFRAGDTDAYQTAVTKARDFIDCGTLVLAAPRRPILKSLPPATSRPAPSLVRGGGR
jgi:hypothetical protein